MWQTQPQPRLKQQEFDVFVVVVLVAAPFEVQ